MSVTSVAAEDETSHGLGPERLDLTAHSSYGHVL